MKWYYIFLIVIIFILVITASFLFNTPSTSKSYLKDYASSILEGLKSNQGIDLNKDWQITNIQTTSIEKYLFYNVSAVKQGNDLIITARVNTSVYNFLKDAYQNPTINKCNIIKAYIEDDFPEANCTQIQDYITRYAENRIRTFRNGIEQGIINVNGTEITVIFENVSSGMFKVGENSIIVIADVSSNGIHTNTRPENNFTHLSENDDSLVAYLPFDVNALATKTYDYSNNNNDATISGATYNSSGKLGGAYTFDGVNDYLSMADSASFDTLNKMTISAWIYPISRPAYAGVVTKYPNSGTRVFLLDAGNGAGYARFYIRTSVDKDLGFNNTDIPLNQWSMLTGMYNGTDLTIWLNGVEKNRSAVTGNVITNNIAVVVGRLLTDYNGFYFNGSIDDIMILNRSLSNSEMVELYNFQYARFHPSGTATYNFTKDTNDNAVNISIPINTLNGTSIQARIEGCSASDWQTITSITNYSFIVNTGVTECNVTFNLTSNVYNSYTPEILSPLNIYGYAEAGGECQNNITNSSWTDWINLTCISNQMNQSRFYTTYDSNNCGNFTNETYYDYQLVNPIWLNTSKSEYANVGICLANDTQLQNRSWIEYDSYGCGVNVTWSETREIACNFCSYNNVNTSYSPWGEIGCVGYDLNVSRNWTEYDANADTCYAITGIASDLWNGGVNVTWYEYDLNLSELQNTTNVYTNISCLSDDTMNQSVEFTEYDVNDLGCFTNTTFTSYIQNETCDFCTPILTNTTFTDWINIGCIGESGYHNESRNKTEYDVNVCGEVGNTTWYEYRSVANSSCDAPDTTPPTWVNCRNLTGYTNTSFSQRIYATDSSGIESYRLNATDNFAVNQSGSITNNTFISIPTLFNLNLSVNDTIGNQANCIFWINLSDYVAGVSSINIQIFPHITNKVPYIKYHRRLKFG